MTTRKSHGWTGRSPWARILPVSAMALTIIIASSGTASAGSEHKSRGDSDKSKAVQSRGDSGKGKAAREVRRPEARRSDEKSAHVEPQRVERAPSRSVERDHSVTRERNGSRSDDTSKQHDLRSYDRGDHRSQDHGDDRSYDRGRTYDRKHYDARWRSSERVERSHPRKVDHVKKWVSNAEVRWNASIHIGSLAYECYRPIRRVPRQVVYWHERPYYNYASLGVYFPRFWIDFVFTDASPYGYLYYDPYCDDFFPKVSAYSAHLHYRDHPPVLDIVYIDDIEYDPVYVQRVSSPWWAYECGY